ncbi:unnamed protein product [Rhizoctonia solani]|uniref:BTB domain-containing protein n=1 Tax=Rhizoctonia solani TaxID=456999 RepID=A0A8H3B2R8_9AGAM|nr:unnamed protein product [Rhizoctonia solani]
MTPKDTQGSYESKQVPSPDLSEAELVSLGSDRDDKPEVEQTVYIPKANTVHPEFAFEDANIEVQTISQNFWVHEFQLSKLAKIGELIQGARKTGVSDSGNRVKIICDGDSVDFCNTFRAMYSPAILGVPEFEVDILVSASRIASVYDYADLRNFAIGELEKCSLPAINQIKLSDEFFLPHWEKPAFVDLCYRSEPITSSEAQTLGIERFTEIARIREAQQRHHFIEMFNKSVEPYPLLTQMEGPDKASALRRDAEFSSRHATLPECDCRIHKDESGARFMARCQIHKLAPTILKESRTLFEQRNELLNRLASLNKAIAAENREVVDEMQIASVESELNRASWIRRASSKCAVL